MSTVLKGSENWTPLVDLGSPLRYEVAKLLGSGSKQNESSAAEKTVEAATLIECGFPSLNIIHDGKPPQA